MTLLAVRTAVRTDVRALGAALALVAALGITAGCGRPEAAPAPAGESPAATVTESFKVSGMTCGGCEGQVKATVAKVEGVVEVKADHKAGQAIVTYDPARAGKDEIRGAIEKAGYKVEG